MAAGLDMEIQCTTSLEILKAQPIFGTTKQTVLKINTVAIFDIGAVILPILNPHVAPDVSHQVTG